MARLVEEKERKAARRPGRECRLNAMITRIGRHGVEVNYLAMAILEFGADAVAWRRDTVP